jgi:hypothetical protein
MILGEPRSQPKKILQRAKTLSEMTELLSEVNTADIAEFYKLSLVKRENVIDAVFRFTHDRLFLKYVRGLTDDEYCIERYKLWLDFRKENKSVCNSEEYFRVKYGNTWQNHQTEYLRNKPNTYDIAHWMSNGMTEEQARDKVKAIKYETSLSLERCIELYGEAEGRERHKFIHRFHKNYGDYWEDDLEGFTKYKRETNRCTVDFWMKRGYSKEDSVKMVSTVQKMYSGLHREFYESRNLSKEEIERIMQSINEKKDSSSLEFCLDKYGEKGLEIYEERSKSKSSCFREYGKLAEELHEGFRGYSARVDRATHLSLKKIPQCPGKRGRHKGEYQIDHRYSKMQGYLNNINPDIIGHHENLEWILTEENCSKRMKCSITLEELMEKINENQKNKS